MGTDWYGLFEPLLKPEPRMRQSRVSPWRPAWPAPLEDRRKCPDMIVEATSWGWVTCPGCGIRFRPEDRQDWTGRRHSACGQRIKLSNSEPQTAPIWCLVCSIAENPVIGEDGGIVHTGHRHFRAGAKVYCCRPVWGGKGIEKAEVLGHHRGSRGLAQVYFQRRWLVNCRAELVYSPSIQDELYGDWDGSPQSKERAEQLAAELNRREGTHAPESPGAVDNTGSSG